MYNLVHAYFPLKKKVFICPKSSFSGTIDTTDNEESSSKMTTNSTLTSRAMISILKNNAVPENNAALKNQAHELQSHIGELEKNNSGAQEQISMLKNEAIVDAEQSQTDIIEVNNKSDRAEQRTRDPEGEMFDLLNLEQWIDELQTILIQKEFEAQGDASTIRNLQGVSADTERKLLEVTQERDRYLALLIKTNASLLASQ